MEGCGVWRGCGVWSGSEEWQSHVPSWLRLGLLKVISSGYKTATETYTYLSYYYSM